MKWVNQKHVGPAQPGRDTGSVATVPVSQVKEEGQGRKLDIKIKQLPTKLQIRTPELRTRKAAAKENDFTTRFDHLIKSKMSKYLSMLIRLSCNKRITARSTSILLSGKQSLPFSTNAGSNKFYDSQSGLFITVPGTRGIRMHEENDPSILQTSIEVNLSASNDNEHDYNQAISQIADLADAGARFVPPLFLFFLLSLLPTDLV